MCFLIETNDFSHRKSKRENLVFTGVKNKGKMRHVLGDGRRRGVRCVKFDGGTLGKLENWEIMLFNISIIFMIYLRHDVYHVTFAAVRKLLLCEVCLLISLVVEHAEGSFRIAGTYLCEKQTDKLEFNICIVLFIFTLGICSSPPQFIVVGFLEELVYLFLFIFHCKFFIPPKFKNFSYLFVIAEDSTILKGVRRSISRLFPFCLVPHHSLGYQPYCFGGLAFLCFFVNKAVVKSYGIL